jgi:hypothetical protein
MGKTYNSVLVSDVSPRVASWALLAAMDDLRLRSVSDPTVIPVLCAVARTPYLAMATTTLCTDPHPLTDDVHRVNVDRESFNSRVNLSSYERETPLGQASVWTLVKVISAQWRAGVNRCYRPGQRDLPIISAPSVPKGDKPKPKPKTKTKAKTDENYDGEHAKPMSRCPEDSAWRNRASMDLVRILYDIKDLYNHILWSDPDLSQAYAEQGRLRREQRDAQYAKRQEARQTQVKVQAKTRVKVQAKTQAKVVPEAKVVPDAKVVPEAKVVIDAKVVPEANAETEGFVTVVRKTQSKDKAKPRAKTQPKTWDKRISH